MPGSDVLRKETSYQTLEYTCWRDRRPTTLSRLAGQANNAPTIILYRAACLAAVPVCAQDPTPVSSCGVQKLYLRKQRRSEDDQVLDGKRDLDLCPPDVSSTSNYRLSLIVAKRYDYRVQASQALCTSTFYPRLFGYYSSWTLSRVHTLNACRNQNFYREVDGKQVRRQSNPILGGPDFWPLSKLP